jgi:drug/metabolite transporter (DMT)-like permease
MFAALEYGPVTVISPLIAGYPLVTLLLSRAFLGKEDVGPQLIAGVTGAVCGVVCCSWCKQGGLVCQSFTGAASAAALNTRLRGRCSGR